MDYNEDRQVYDREYKDIEEDGLVNRVVKADDDSHASIHLNTIGIQNVII